MKEKIIKFTKKETNLIKSIHEDCIGEKISIDECNRKYKKEYTPEDILIAREKRVCRQEILLEKYKSTLLTIRVNYPGINKNNYISFGIIKVLSGFVVKEFDNKTLHKEFNITAEGPIITMIIDDDHNKVKFKAVEIEEKHLLGRCADIDVYDNKGKGLSRSELGLCKRKCYLCSDFAHNCVRSRKHSTHEIEEFIKDKFEEYYNSEQSKYL